MPSFHYFAHPPVPALAPFIELIWGVRGSAAFTMEAVLPNGVVELMVNFGPTQKVIAYGDRAVDERFRWSWLAGIQDRPLTISSPEGCDHIGVRFRPGGAHAFFGVPMDEVKGALVDLDLLIGAGAAAGLRDRLGELPTDLARCREVERWLLGRRYAVHPYYATTRRAIDLLHASAYDMTITDLCGRLGLSNRHLIDQFRRVVGLPPKTLARVQRFHAVVRALVGRDDADWAGLAYRYHFADQSHLVREFRHFAGVTPTEFLGRRSPDHVSVIVA